MCCKKMVNIFKKLRHIVLGTWRNLTHKSNELAEKRLLICETCEHKKYLTKTITYCDLCGCITRSKTLVKDEHCSLNKW